MNEKFLSLDAEKQERIINAALKEFVQKGFEKASTNEIVKEANISKGLLFHYFKNKKQLFLFLYDHAVEVIMEEFFGKMDLLEADILIRWRQLVGLKMELMKQYPEMFNFLARAVNSEEIEEINDKNKENLAANYERVFKGIDYSKFRDDVDVQHAMNIIIWTFQGFANEQQEKTKFLSVEEYDVEEILKGIDSYVEALRKALYK